jgi:hypothetical protein
MQPASRFVYGIDGYGVRATSLSKAWLVLRDRPLKGKSCGRQACYLKKDRQHDKSYGHAAGQSSRQASGQRGQPHRVVQNSVPRCHPATRQAASFILSVRIVKGNVAFAPSGQITKHPLKADPVSGRCCRPNQWAGS